MTEKDPKATWVFPATVTKFPDGSCLVKPGKAIQRATVAQAVKITGVHRKTLHALADAGLIHRERPSPSQAFFYPGEIEDLLKQTADDPSFWNKVRTRAFLTGKDLRNSKPK